MNPVASDSDCSDSDDSDGNLTGLASAENRNEQNTRFPAYGRMQAQVQTKIKSQRQQAMNEEKIRELESKWWLQGDIEAVKRAIQTQKEQA